MLEPGVQSKEHHLDCYLNESTHSWQKMPFISATSKSRIVTTWEKEKLMHEFPHAFLL